jgi:hypothetical protein
VPGEDILLLYLNSNERIVQDRIRNFLTKYLGTASEVTDAEVTEVSGFEPGEAKFAKARRGAHRRPPRRPRPQTRAAARTAAASRTASRRPPRPRTPAPARRQRRSCRMGAEGDIR